MSSTQVFSPTGSPGDSFILFSRVLEVQRVHDQLEHLYALQPLPDCLPDWRGESKNGYIDKLAEMTTMFVSVRLEVSEAIRQLNRAIAELGVV